MDHIIELNNFNDQDECCICLNTLDKKNDIEYITLDCCKKNIHKGCFITWICSGYYVSLKCPMCRANITNINEMISLREIYNMNMTLNNNTLSVIREYYRDDELYHIYNININYNRNNTNNNNNIRDRVILLDRSLIKSLCVFIFILVLCIIILFIIDVKRNKGVI